LLLKHVVTSFLQSDQKILLLRRSSKVGSYQGRWAGVSGYLEEGEDPLQRAKTEIEEELGLSSTQARLVRSGELLRAFDEQKETVWIVHPFLFEAREQNLRLDWEHAESRWIHPDDLRLYETVPKLKEAFERVRWDLRAATSTLSTTMRSVDELARDRVHGASTLGRRSIQVLAEAARVSNANSISELFSNLLSVALELRRAQPSMATIRNQTGRFLYDVQATTQTATSVDQFREMIASLGQKAQADAGASAEDASRNSVAILPEEGYVLTHSYSSTVRRALELCVKSKHELTVYVTESSPGLEGKQLAKDLIGIGVPVRLIADSAVGSVISDVDMVVVGADSVLGDGSVINKIGTRKIAVIAEEEEVPFCVVCESAKFSTLDFLGEPVHIAETLFDLTPREYISKIVTESGSIEPQEVEQQIKKMLSQLYP
jgi:translation initiation factor 2B subunit (eIF-2B alpha/beta/delta family)/ADP-ribose pyrophosphatase YjhB (NUDIX family)